MYQAPAKPTSSPKDGFFAAGHRPSVHDGFKLLVPQSERIAAAERATTAQQRFAKEHNLKLAGSRKKRIQAADVLGPSSQQSTESSGSDFTPDKAPPAKSAARFRTPFLGLKRKATNLPADLLKESRKTAQICGQTGQEDKEVEGRRTNARHEIWRH